MLSNINKLVIIAQLFFFMIYSKTTQWIDLQITVTICLGNTNESGVILFLVLKETFSD